MICPSCGTANEETAEVCFTCRTVLAALTRGSVLGGRYEIRDVLGRGGMGTVYRAHDRVLDDEVALKVLRAEGESDLDLARRFRSEIKLARRVAHPHVCRIYEYGEEGTRRYISMELVEGTNLKEVLRQDGPLRPEQAFAVAIDVAEGLAAIHEAGIVHRDLKTPNVMRGRAGAVKVMDFGIAKKVAGGGVTGPSGSYVVGSPEYMSPEQARGQPVDFRSDLYALGVVVFEIFTGRVPFRGDTPVATLLLHLEAPPPLDGPEGAAIPGPLRPVLRRALAKDAAARHASAGEMARALRAARDASLGGGSVGEPDARPRRRAWPWLVLATGVVAGLIALATQRAPVPAETVPRPDAPATPPAPISEAPTTTMASPPPASPSPSAPSVRPATPSARRETFASPETAASVSPPATVARSPTPPPVAPSPTAAAPVPPATPEPDGVLAVQVTPWADVSIDNRPVGQTPLQLSLPPGPHAVVLTHPDFQPYHRRIDIPAGKTVRLVVHLAAEGIRRRP
jgi:serine/threonine protein kinase